MQFRLPNANVVFDIPEEWIREAGALGFRPTVQAYRGTPHDTYKDFPLVVVPIHDIEPPGGGIGTPLFDRRRMVSALRALARGAELTAVVLQEWPTDSVYRYALWEGAHRFYASAALGFSHVPASVVGGSADLVSEHPAPSPSNDAKRGPYRRTEH
jgi:hypothetical protein